MAASCRAQFGFTPDQLLEMTFSQLRVLFRDPQELDEEFRYKRMDEQTRRKADAFKQKYGRF